MKHLRVGSLAALAAAALPLLAGCGTSGSGGLEALNGTPMPYHVVVTGSWPDTQIQGSSVELQMRAQNIGSPVPHLVMVFDGLVPTWAVRRASGCGHPAVTLKSVGADPAFDFGALQKGQICDYTLKLTPQSSSTSGKVFVRLFGAAISGKVGMKVPINGGMELVGTVSG
jgi:hypothetical protein